MSSNPPSGSDRDPTTSGDDANEPRSEESTRLTAAEESDVAPTPQSPAGAEDTPADDSVTASDDPPWRNSPTESADFVAASAPLIDDGWQVQTTSDADAATPKQSPVPERRSPIGQSPARPGTRPSGPNQQKARRPRKAPQEPLTLPRQVGDYRLVEELSRTAIGVLYAAETVGDQTPVQVEVLSNKLEIGPRAFARFKTETVDAGNAHPGIAEVYGAGATGRERWVAKPAVDGVSIDHYFAQRNDDGRDVRLACELIAGVAEALHAAHQAGGVHRDLHPGNIVVDSSGRTTVVNFGLARDDGRPCRTAETPDAVEYFSPEQADENGAAVDRRSDVFSLGTILYELITERKPFVGSSAEAVRRAIRTKTPQDPMRVDPTLADGLLAILRKAHAKDPRRRYQTALEFAEDLRCLLGLRPIRSARISGRHRVARIARQPKQLAAIVGGGVAAVLLIVTATLTLGSGESAAWKQIAIANQRVDALLLAGAEARFRNDFAGARESYQDAHDVAPDHPLAIAAAMVDLSHSSRRDADPEAAIALLEQRAPEAEPEPGLSRIRATLLHELGEIDDAETLRSSLGEPTTPLEHFAVAHELMLDLWRGRGREAKARTAMRDLQRAVLTSERPNPLFLTELVEMARRAGADEMEHDAAAAIAQLWPDAPIGWMFLARYWAKRDDVQARAAAERVLELSPESFWAHAQLGGIHGREQEWASAIEHYEKAWGSSNDGEVGLEYARTLRTGGYEDKALRIFERIGNDGLVARRAWSERIEFLLELDRSSEALAAATDASKRWPKDAALMRGHANALAANGSNDQAARVMERAIDLAPKDPDGHAQFAWLLIDVDRWGDYESWRRALLPRALASARRAVYFSKRKDPRYLELLADVLDLAGKRREAERTRGEAARVRGK